MCNLRYSAVSSTENEAINKKNCFTNENWLNRLHLLANKASDTCLKCNVRYGLSEACKAHVNSLEGAVEQTSSRHANVLYKFHA